MNRYLVAALVALAVAGCAVPPTPAPLPAPTPPPVAPVPPSPPTLAARLLDLGKFIGRPAEFRGAELMLDGVVCGEVSVAGAAFRRFYSTGSGIVYYTGSHVANLFKAVCGK